MLLVILIGHTLDENISHTFVFLAAEPAALVQEFASVEEDTVSCGQLTRSSSCIQLNGG